jgi:hypothetical protein
MPCTRAAAAAKAGRATEVKLRRASASERDQWRLGGARPVPPPPVGGALHARQLPRRTAEPLGVGLGRVCLLACMNVPRSGGAMSRLTHAGWHPTINEIFNGPGG